MSGFLIRPRTPGAAAPWRRLQSEAGETLIEVLVAITIIALTATGILGALATSITASGQHRAIAQVDSLLKSFAEAAKYQLELQLPTASTGYMDCATPSTYNTGTHAVVWTPPAPYTSGYTVVITAVLPWDVTTKAFDSAHSASCTTGLQLLTIKATGPAPGNISDTMNLIVRNPAFIQSFGTVNAGF